MSSLVVRVLSAPVITADGRQLSTASLVAPLVPFVVPVAEVQAGSEGFPLATSADLARFLEHAEPRNSTAVATVTAAIPTGDNYWILVPDDEDDYLTMQLFEFVESRERVLLVPTVADVSLPTESEALIPFFAQAAETALWRGRRHRKPEAVCVDTEAGDCEGASCQSGCTKVIWGNPNSPRWACVCPGA